MNDGTVEIQARVEDIWDMESQRRDDVQGEQYFCCFIELMKEKEVFLTLYLINWK